MPQTACEKHGGDRRAAHTQFEHEMNSGSRQHVEYRADHDGFMATEERPCAVMKPFRPSAVITKTVPST